MYRKFLLFILLGVCVSANAQKLSVIKQAGGSMAKLPEMVLSRQWALSQVRIPSVQLGREALRLHVSSVGVDNYAQKARRFAWASSLALPDGLINRLSGAHWIVPPFPGYVVSLKDLSGFSPTQQALVLNSAYGVGTKYCGVFVSTFEEVRALSFRPVKDGKEALRALQSARRQAAEKKKGFLAVAIEGNANRPKDILIWTPTQNSWLSWNYSKAVVLRKEHEVFRLQFKDQHAYWAWQLENQGIVVRPNSYDEPSSVRVSQDGINWQEFGLDTRLGAALWNAWKDGLYISYNRHSRTASFALDKDAPFFSSPELVKLWKESLAAGIMMQETAEGLPVLVLSGQQYPNLYSYGADGGVRSVPGVRLVAGESFPVSPLRFMEELQKIAAAEYQAHPSAKVVFLEEKARSGDFNEVSDCVEIQ